jgi:hypothetical protein
MSESTQTTTQPTPTTPQPDGGMGPHGTPTEDLQPAGGIGPHSSVSALGSGKTASPNGGMGPHS